MKFCYSILAALLLITFSCKKEKDGPPQNNAGQELATELNMEAGRLDSLSSFAVYLKELEIPGTAAAAGVTVFAPVNQAFANAGGRQAPGQAAALREALPDSSDVEDYIVKGIFGEAELTDGRQLTTLNGHTLAVSRSGNLVRINGVLLSGAGVATGKKSIIHSLAGLLKKAPAITVAVWDATRWAAGKPKGEAAEGATVALYRSREDYAAGRPAAYTAETGADGKARFKKVEAGTYYIVASKGEMSSVLKEPGLWSGVPVDGVYAGYASDSLFQSAADVGSHPQPNGNTGNFRYEDVNADGKVDEHDFVQLPFHSVEAAQGATVSASLLIGYGNNASFRPLASIEMAQTLLAGMYTGAAASFITGSMMDGYLSDDADGAGSWMAIDRFTFGPGEKVFSDSWNLAYSAIRQLNRLLRDVPQMPAAAERDQLLAQAKALRAFFNLQLLAYYGKIPVVNGVLLPYNMTNSDPQAVFNQLLADLQDAAAKLPATWDEQHAYQLTSGAAHALLARAYLLQKDYAQAAAYARQVIGSGTYKLAYNPEDPFQGLNKIETIWDIAGRAGTPEFKAYFTRGSFCPALRLTEMYLTAAEGMIEQGDGALPAEVSTYINTLYGRRGFALPIKPGTTRSEAKAYLAAIWQQEMRREGNRFTCLRRWGMAEQVLASKGYVAAKNAWMPIPLSFLNAFPGLLQNPGY